MHLTTATDAATTITGPALLGLIVLALFVLVRVVLAGVLDRR